MFEHSQDLRISLQDFQSGPRNIFSMQKQSESESSPGLAVFIRIYITGFSPAAHRFLNRNNTVYS